MGRPLSALTNAEFFVWIFLLTTVIYLPHAIYKKWWPWMMRNTGEAFGAASNDSHYRLHAIISDNLERVYYLHASKLLSYEANKTPVDGIDLSDLTALPGTDDAFWIDFSRNTGRCLKESLPVDTLLARLNPAPNARQRFGGSAQLMRRTVGGLTRFQQVDFNNIKYTVLTRYIGTYYPERATQAVGVILDREWFIKQVPTIMDSLARENQAILFMAPAPPDTQWLKVSDPYRAPNNEWKQTMGIIERFPHGRDTLWWYGDPKVKIGHGDIAKSDLPGYAVPIGPFDLEVLVKTEFPQLQSDIMAGYKIVKWLIPTLIVVLQGALILLLFSFEWALVQSRRNRIALAHLAHSVKTPVARLKLVTDTLTTERVASPEEERALISAVGRECGRLERAVQNAALSLQKGRRTYNIIPGDLTATVREIADSWQTSFSQAGIRLDVDADAEKIGLVVKYDAAMMAVALDNLLDNALRHTRLNLLKPGLQTNRATQQTSDLLKPGLPAIRGTQMDAIPTGQARVNIRTQQIDNKAVITVDDMGGGIPKSERKKIFRRFGRVSRDAATGATGLGLGLALVKEIVEAHKGSIRVEDSPLGGARFVLELQIVD
jgi:signal transduction histidine kinase